ncbi:hypothetical protein LX12_001280 [Williamsia serinedens]|uniref:Asp23/Gls24 family envelope stress response protein n=2 Tax=Williamsia serinedens TaxID=391736 RepID=A0ABT1GYN8_9NOCA|nr:hypothetical protein [Williamsia serinedens]
MMVDMHTAEPRTEDWILEAGRRLGPTTADITRLTKTVVDTARRLSQSRDELATDDGLVVVTDRVVRRLILLAVRSALGRRVVEVSVRIAEGEAVGVTLGLVGQYADDLQTVAVQARAAIEALLADVLGEEHAAKVSAAIDVHWADLE